MSVLGDNMKYYRQARGYSTDVLGRLVGHSGGSYIRAAEAGRKHPGDALAARIAASLGVTTAELTSSLPRRQAPGS